MESAASVDKMRRTSDSVIASSAVLTILVGVGVGVGWDADAHATIASDASSFNDLVIFDIRVSRIACELPNNS
jgi:hypothetical protein